MKAKDLIKILKQYPEAEVLFKQYVGVEIITDVKNADLYKQGTFIDHRIQYKCKTDTIYLSTDE
ncbi:hypothetical protein [Escherichia phage UB]|uniref:Uncharacterized protein n=1 Tax=Escherichia phage UB TaxID=2268588 RepID=A0A2Z5HAW2_9CAUD|nr:hypothetical protein [Escherichia phage UB]